MGSYRSSLPSCLVNYIRKLYPDADGSYTGFLEKPSKKIKVK